MQTTPVSPNTVCKRTGQWSGPTVPLAARGRGRCPACSGLWSHQRQRQPSWPATERHRFRRSWNKAFSTKYARQRIARSELQQRRGPLSARVAGPRGDHSATMAPGCAAPVARENRVGFRRSSVLEDRHIVSKSKGDSTRYPWSRRPRGMLPAQQ